MTRKKRGLSFVRNVQELDSEIGVSEEDAGVPRVDEAVAGPLELALLARHLHVFDVPQHQVFWGPGVLADGHLKSLLIAMFTT